jgi:hypothetical protein
MNDDRGGVTAAEPPASQFLCALAFGSRTGAQVLSEDGELGRHRPYLCAAPSREPGPRERLVDELGQRPVLARCHLVPLSPSPAEPVRQIRVSAMRSWKANSRGHRAGGDVPSWVVFR